MRLMEWNRKSMLTELNLKDLMRLQMTTIALLLTCSLSSITRADETLVPIEAQTFIVVPGQPTELAWTTRQPEGTLVNYTLSDYQGQHCGDGIATVGQDKLRTTVTLEQGYYDITLNEQTFGILAMPHIPAPLDDFFGMDVVLTWLEQKAERRESIVKTLRRCGVGFARDRFSWGRINPKPGVYDWNEFNHADAVRKLYGDNGIKVLEMFHDPGIARGTFPVPCRLPQDMLPIPGNFPGIYQRWQSTWGALEVWNEPDAGYGADLPADAYVPLVHTMNWTFRNRDSQTMPIGGGVLTDTYPGPYHEFLARNGILDSVDFISFHDYRLPSQLEGLVDGYRKWLAQYGQPHKSLWLTECGFPWAKGGGRAKRDEDANSAWQIVAKGAIAMSCGLEHYFPFCMPFYEEGGVKSFSMIGKDLTPMRSMAAYAQLVRVLSHRQYIGDLSLADDQDVSARVFTGDDRKTLVVLIAPSLEQVNLTLPLTPLRVEAVDGRQCSNQSMITVTDGITYAWVDSAAVMPLLKTDTPTMTLLNMAKKPEKYAIIAHPIVMQHEPDIKQVGLSPSRYVVLPGQASALNLTVKVSNLDEQDHAVTLKLQLPGEAQPLIKQVKLAAGTMQPIPWLVDASKALSAISTKPITVTATDASGNPIAAQLAMPFRLEGDLSMLLSNFPKITRLAINDLPRWQKNIISHGTQKLQAMDFDQSHGVQMDIRFTKPGDRWFYPKFTVKNEPVAQSHGLIVRVKSERAGTLRMILNEQGGGGYWTNSPIVPADGQWHVAYIDFSEFLPLPSHADMENGKLDPDKIAYISVGMHDVSAELSNTMQISDLILVQK